MAQLGSARQPPGLVVTGSNPGRRTSAHEAARVSDLRARARDRLGSLCYPSPKGLHVLLCHDSSRGGGALPIIGPIEVSAFISYVGPAAIWPVIIGYALFVLIPLPMNGSCSS